jgi:hypothetical protein
MYFLMVRKELLEEQQRCTKKSLEPYALTPYIFHKHAVQLKGADMGR